MNATFSVSLIPK